MTTELLAVRLMRHVTERRKDLRPHQRAHIVTQLLAMQRENHVGITINGDLFVSPDAESIIGSPPKQEEQPAPSPPDTSELQAELAKEQNPIRRAQIRERIGIANGITSTRENP